MFINPENRPPSLSFYFFKEQRHANLNSHLERDRLIIQFAVSLKQKTVVA